MGVLAFSFSVPFTRLAVQGGLPPLFVGAGRAVVAAVLAAAALALTRQRLPRARQWVRLLVVAGGVVAGFPLLTSLALDRVPAGHSAVVIGLLPAATAATVVLRTRERVAARFWVAAGAGAVAVAGVTAAGSGLPQGAGAADLLLVGAVLAAALGYAEGGLLARELGAWQTVSWALVLASPAMLAVTVVALLGPATADDRWSAVPASAWAAFAYLAAVSMYLGFFAWYRGLALGPMAQVSQVQLLQPVLSLVWATLLLGEHLAPATVVGGAVVIACARSAVRARQAPPARPAPGRTTAEPPVAR